MALLKVMCIDDDLPILKGLRAFPWEKYHCRWVAEACDGKSALEQLPGLRPDLILVDICMPVLDGLSFISLARGLVPDARFVILSAHCDFEYARRAMRFGVTEYLTKGEYCDEELGEVLLRFTKPEAHSAYRYEVERTLRTIESRLGEDLTLESVAEEVGMSPNYLGSLFYQQTGVRFRDHLTALRMKRARELLLHTPLKIYEVSQQVGIQNPQYFTALFQKAYGMTPGQLRK